MAETTCRHCGSAKMMSHVLIFDQGNPTDNLRAGIPTAPEALIFKAWVFAPIFADICGDCGRLDTYVDDPQKLYEAYLKTTQEKE